MTQQGQGGAGAQAPQFKTGTRASRPHNFVQGRLPFFDGRRELFPLPLPSCASPAPTGTSRRARQRATRRREISEVAADAVRALNALAGCRAGVDRPAALDDAHTSVHNHVLRTVAHTKPDCAAPRPRAAFCELLGGRSTLYSGIDTKVVSFDAAKVSCPSLGSKPIPLDKLLGDQAHQILDPDKMLVEEEIFRARLQDDPIKLYGDPVLAGSAECRKSITKMLVEAGLLGASHHR